jgi:hypothetical protein
MARTSLQDVQSVQDPMLAFNFDLVFPALPGTGTAAARELIIKCTSTSIPESQLEQVSVEAKSVKLHFAGRRMWSGTWNTTMFESRSSSTRDAIIAWHELCRSWVGNSGSYKSVYAVPVEIVLYDDLPQVIRRIRMHGVFPQSTGAPTLGSNSEIVSYEITWSFDYTEDLAP